MLKRSVVNTYLTCLENKDLDSLLSLFHENATVRSPVYGTLPAHEFYKQLFQDTQASRLIKNDIFENPENGRIALHFNYEWVLDSGAIENFSVVDIFDFDDNQKITELIIIYNAKDTLERVNELKKMRKHGKK